jgi:hypothetical protein
MAAAAHPVLATFHRAWPTAALVALVALTASVVVVLVDRSLVAWLAAHRALAAAALAAARTARYRAAQASPAL